MEQFAFTWSEICEFFEKVIDKILSFYVLNLCDYLIKSDENVKNNENHFKTKPKF